MKDTRDHSSYVLARVICGPRSSPFLDFIGRDPLLIEEEPLQGLFVPVGRPLPVVLRKGGIGIIVFCFSFFLIYRSKWKHL